MPEAVTRQNLFAYRTTPLSDIVATLSDAVAVKDKLLTLNIPGLESLLARLERILQVASTSADGNPFIMAEQATITYLDPAGVRIFLNRPESKPVRDEVAAQLISLDMLINTSDDFKPYTLEEIQAIFKGPVPYYDDLLFLGTLRALLFDVENDWAGSLLINTLPVGKDAVNAATFAWDEIVMLSTIVQVVWKSFVFLTDAEQTTLLQNYFYRAIVMGVPVRQWLVSLLKNLSPEAAVKASNIFVQAILNGNEYLPQNTSGTNLGFLPEVARAYLARVSSENVAILAQEQFLSEWYQGEEDKEFFSAWLRETLTIIWHLKNGDLA